MISREHAQVEVGVDYDKNIRGLWPFEYVTFYFWFDNPVLTLDNYPGRYYLPPASSNRTERAVELQEVRFAKTEISETAVKVSVRSWSEGFNPLEVEILSITTPWSKLMMSPTFIPLVWGIKNVVGNEIEVGKGSTARLTQRSVAVSL